MGVVSYYRVIWPRRSHMLAPLTESTSIKQKFKWKNVEQYALDEIKRIMARDNLLAYLDFNETFKSNNDGKAFHLREVIRQKGKLIAFYGRKITDTQQRFMVTDK